MKYAGYVTGKKQVIVHRTRRGRYGEVPSCRGHYSYSTIGHDRKWKIWGDKTKDPSINYWALAKKGTEEERAFRFLAGIAEAPEWFTKGRPCAKCFPKMFEIKVVPKVAHSCPTCGHEVLAQPKRNKATLKKGWDS